MKIIGSKAKTKKVGFYSGSFDPIHLGHITFALQAVKQNKLDIVYFLPEVKPKGKDIYEPIGHRVAMIKEAVKPHPKLDILELSDKSFNVAKTFTKLQYLFEGSELYFLFGSDKLLNMPAWPYFEKMNNEAHLIIGSRFGTHMSDLRQIAKKSNFKNISFIQTLTPNVSSTLIRESLFNDLKPEGLLTSVRRYINHHWLYISLR